VEDRQDSGKPNKLWPVERFRELARQIGPRAVAVWGPGERELAEAIGARVAPPTNLRELASILRGAAVVIGGDTGPLHLADALGTKVIGLYGPTDPRRNGPYGQLDRVIDHFRTTKLMDSISVEEVMKRLERVSAE
jgi:heptosyltransferase I